MVEEVGDTVVVVPLQYPNSLITGIGPEILTGVEQAHMVTAES